MAEERKDEIHAKFGENEVELRFKIDKAKAEAIRSCLEKGELRISISEADIRKGGRFQASYLYD
jgi:hypothetical protein